MPPSPDSGSSGSGSGSGPTLNSNLMKSLTSVHLPPPPSSRHVQATPTSRHHHQLSPPYHHGGGHGGAMPQPFKQVGNSSASGGYRVGPAASPTAVGVYSAKPLADISTNPVLNTPPPSQLRHGADQQKVFSAHGMNLTTPTMGEGRHASRLNGNKENINPTGIHMLSPIGSGSSPVYQRKPGPPSGQISFDVGSYGPSTFSMLDDHATTHHHHSQPPQQHGLAHKQQPGDASQLEIPRPEDMPEIIDDGTKPPYSYATLIGMAILRSPNRKLTLSQIYHWINDTFKWYGQNKSGWQNSIRHNLSLNKAFKKQERPKSDPGKGHYWLVESGCEHQFVNVKTTRKTTSTHQTSEFQAKPMVKKPQPPLQPPQPHHQLPQHQQNHLHQLQNMTNNANLNSAQSVPDIQVSDSRHLFNDTSSSSFFSYSAANAFSMATSYESSQSSADNSFSSGPLTSTASQAATAASAGPSAHTNSRDSNSTDDEIVNDDDDEDDYPFNDGRAVHRALDDSDFSLNGRAMADPTALDTPLKRCNTAIGLQHFGDSKGKTVLGKRGHHGDDLGHSPSKKKRSSASLGDIDLFGSSSLLLGGEGEANGHNNNAAGRSLYDSPGKGYISGQGLILGPLTASTTLLPPTTQQFQVASPNTSLRNHRAMIRGLTSTIEFDELTGSPSNKKYGSAIIEEDDLVSRVIFGSPDKREAKRRQYYEQSGVMGFDDSPVADVFGVDVCGVVRRAIEGGPSSSAASSSRFGSGSQPAENYESVQDLIRFDSPIKTQGNVFSPPKMARKNTAYF